MAVCQFSTSGLYQWRSWHRQWLYAHRGKSGRRNLKTDIENTWSSRPFSCFQTPNAHLEQSHGIPIERHPQLRSTGYLEPLHEVPAHPRQLRGMLALQQNVPPPPALDALHGTRCGTNDGDFVSRARRYELAKPLSTMNCQLRRGIFNHSTEDDVRKPNVRWVLRIDAANELLTDERLVIVRNSEAN